MTDIGWWRAVKAAGGQVPPERPFSVLLSELEGFLANPEGSVRDGLGFELLGAWVIAGYCDTDLAGMGKRMVTAMHASLGNQGDDTVYKRSFSALLLGLIVERDNLVMANTGSGIFTPDEVHGFADVAIYWMTAERDMRGAIGPRNGVAHAPAHGADLFASLARHSYVDTTMALAMLHSIADRIDDTAGVTLQLSEDERLAYAAVTILYRRDISPNDLAKVLQPLRALASVRHRTDLDPRAHARLNSLNWLRAVYLQLDLGIKPMPWYAADGHYTTKPPAHEQLKETIREALLDYSLWFA